MHWSTVLRSRTGQRSRCGPTPTGCRRRPRRFERALCVRRYPPGTPPPGRQRLAHVQDAIRAFGAASGRARLPGVMALGLGATLKVARKSHGQKEAQRFACRDAGLKEQLAAPPPPASLPVEAGREPLGLADDPTAALDPARRQTGLPLRTSLRELLALWGGPTQRGCWLRAGIARPARRLPAGRCYRTAWTHFLEFERTVRQSGSLWAGVFCLDLPKRIIYRERIAPGLTRLLQSSRRDEGGK